MKRKLKIEILLVIYNVLKNVLCILSDRRLLLRGFSAAKVSSMGNKDCKIYKAELERYQCTNCIESHMSHDIKSLSIVDCMQCCNC